MEICFADNEKGGCLILKKRNCKNCSFFKTQEQFENDRHMALERLKTLSIVRRRSISDIYGIDKNLLGLKKIKIDRG